MRITLVDNYDSFTFNVVQALASLGAAVDVYPNDSDALDKLDLDGVSAVVLSPGPGSPSRAEKSMAVLEQVVGKIPVLGVCLGHQCIGALFGARVVRAREPMHGKLCTIRHDGAGLFRGIESPKRVVRYHSLLLEPASLPPSLRVAAYSEAGEIMAVRHDVLPVEGIQFHPESIFDRDRVRLFSNFLDAARGFSARRRAARKGR